MALETATADKIVSIVANDRLCVSRIKSSSLYRLIGKLTHHAGNIRDLALMVSGISSRDERFLRISCNGMAEATSARLLRASIDGNLPEIKNSWAYSRCINGWWHFGTRVWMADETYYMFDWFFTLDPENPLISRGADWDAGDNGIEYGDFQGFDLFCE